MMEYAYVAFIAVALAALAFWIHDDDDSGWRF